MNYKQKLNLRKSKYQIELWTSLIFIGIALTFFACSKDNEKNDSEKYPSLKVINTVTDNRFISSVKIVGYEFNNLNITSGNSQTFILQNGMPGGYENVNVIVSYKTSNIPSNSKNKTVNFTNGQTTMITLQGCISFEGCTGYSLQ